MGNKSISKKKRVQVEEDLLNSSRLNRADLPVMKLDGITFETVDNSLKEARGSKENTISNNRFLAYNLIDSYTFRDINNVDDVFSDLCVLGNVNATPGCSLYISQCQDDAFIGKKVIDNIDCKVMAVFDGHGKKDGDKVSKCCTYLLSKIFNEEELRCTKSGNIVKINSEEREVPNIHEFIQNPENFFKVSFKFLHDCVCSANDFSAKEAGATATVALLADKILNLAWVGDTQAALFITVNDEFENFRPYFVTSRHNFQTKEEKERVAKAGGRLGHANKLFGKIDPNNTTPIRIFSKRGNGKPGLMISRSLGDQKAHEIGLTHQPEFLSLNFNNIKTIGEFENMLPTEFNKSQPEILFSSSKSSTKNRKAQRLKSTLKKVRNRVDSSLGRKKSKHTIVKTSSEREDFVPQRSLVGQTTMNSVSDTVLNMNQEITHCVLIIGSDGLWDTLTKVEVARMLPELLKERLTYEEAEQNVSLELALKAIDKFRQGFTTPTTSAKSDDISVITSVLF